MASKYSKKHSNGHNSGFRAFLKGTLSGTMSRYGWRNNLSYPGGSGRLTPLCTSGLGLEAKTLEARLEQQHRFRILRAVKCLEDVPDSELEALALAVRAVDVGAGQLVFSEGDAAPAVYVIERGKVEFSRSGSEIAALVAGEGGCFGEAALFAGSRKRRASAVAGTCCASCTTASSAAASSSRARATTPRAWGT